MSLLHTDRYCTLWTKHFIILFFMSIFTLPVNNLYRAMLCVSVAFAVVWCPSACLSVTFVYCIQMAEAIVRHLPRSGSPSFYFFLWKRRYLILMGTSSAGVQNTQGGRGICNLRLKSLFISETVQDRPMVAMER